MTKSPPFRGSNPSHLSRSTKMKILLLLATTLIFTVAGAMSDETPKSLGFTFPDEWGEHRGTMMIFPAEHSYGRKTKELRKEFVNIAEAIAKNEAVEVFCFETETDACRKLLGDNPNIRIHSGDYSIDWARDNAPMVLRDKDGRLASAGFRFNGWGEKYRGWENDIETRDNISREIGWPIFHSDLVLEGGAIEIGGKVGIVTESCVLNPNRTNWSKEKVEEELKNMLGLEKIIWIKSGLMPDQITDGHVDGLLKFVAKDTVLLHTTDLESDINYRICQDAKRVLLANGLKVVELPLMDDIVHMNFYIGSNGDVAYVPICGDPEQDEPALKVIRTLYKKVIPIMSVNMAEEGGGIHCFTQQIPR
ncbi:agmatine deiminase family protein [Rubellicoccus peritrichatus]|uniref:Agmatine deiminase family protein n=1 Tax=Rubellicoccus peritrichatus TaxID=3080537 RepID=A0AAQ3QVD0_9BACT|nr:agmatine deiminase family protein [Puniceicoccus sp. CR14]WOO43321.1 agmatine deiminase family protein [Puniceicoccus sp. CR14]